MAEVGSYYISIMPSLKGFTKDVSKSCAEAGSAGGKSFLDGFGGAVGKGASVVGKALAGATAAAGAAIAAISKQALDSYADYEQLAGGIETLFGSTANEAMANAQNAFKTAGMSANEYMDTVMGFSASLKQALGDEYAWQMASYADEAVKDMADNANKMGTSMESIQNAYQGFAKGNFTMLDNLKLGYGGTKTEMERLLRRAEELEGFTEGSLSIDNFADIVTAIHAVQEEMGITGTTAKEAASTIEGSIGMAKAAWQNWLTGLAREDADLGALTQDLLDTFEAVFRNVVPRLTIIVERIVRSLPKILSMVTSQLPGIVGPIAKAAVDVIGGLVETALASLGIQLPPGILSFDSLKAAFDGFVGWVREVWNGFTSTFDSSGFETALANVKQILSDAWGFVEDHIIPLAPVIGEFLGYAASALGKVLAAITEVVKFIEPYVAQALLWVGDLISKILEFAKTHEDLRDFVKAAWEVIKRTVSEFVEKVKTAIAEKFEAIRTATVEKWQAVKDAIAAKVQAAKDAVAEKFNAIRESIRTTVDNIKTSMTEKWNNIKTTISEKVAAAKQAIVDKFTAAKDKALGIFDDIKRGIRDKIQWAKEKVSKIIDDIKGLFDFSWSLPSPKLPHITWSWQDVGGIVSIPSFGVDWYGKGGVFDTATLIGIGEKGREAALPLNDQTYREIANGISKQAGGSVGVTVTGNTFIVREEADIDRIAAELDRRIRRERMAMA